MSDRGTSRAELQSAVEAAGNVLAQAFGLGDETRITADWPIDDGDSVLVAQLTGDSTGTMVLAVNEEVAERLLNDPNVLNTGFANALTAAVAAVGFELTLGTVGSGDSTAPAVIVEILDGGSLTALAGLTLPIAETAPVAPTFEPESFDGHAAGAAPTMVAATSLSVLNDVEMIVTAELGRTTMPVRDLLGLTPGMVVEIDRAAGAPIDLLVNGRRIAAGEVVVIDEEFGIRITEIAPVGDRPR